MNCSFNIRYKPRTTRQFTKSDLAVYDSAGNTALNALTVYGKSEVVDGAIISAGEGWSVVDLGTLTWQYRTDTTKPIFQAVLPNLGKPHSESVVGNYLCKKYLSITSYAVSRDDGDKGIAISAGGDRVYIQDLSYTDATAFKTAVSGVLLCYELANPTQGNTIAIKTDNGTGINGTMTVFSTGTPLRGIPETNVRDVMTWDGSAGAVTKNCYAVDLGTFLWYKDDNYTAFFSPSLNDIIKTGFTNSTPAPMICGKYVTTAFYTAEEGHFEGKDKAIAYAYKSGERLYIKDTDYTDATAFKNSLSGIQLVYELATPTTEQLTTAENNSIAGLRTFEPQTHAQNNAQTDMTVDYTIRVPTI